MELDTENRQVMKECIRMYGALSAVEAFLEYEYADKYHVLPHGARFLEALEPVTDKDGDTSYIFVWHDPDELRKQ